MKTNHFEILRALDHNGALTGKEVANVTGQTVFFCKIRLSEMQAKHLIRQTHVPGTIDYDNRVHKWEITPAGKDRLSQARRVERK